MGDHLHGPDLGDAPLGSRPTALILSGGAALGSWQGGVLYALEKEYGFSFHSVAGTSAGCLNGVGYFQNKTDNLRELWRDIPGGLFMRLAPRLRPPSIYSQQAIRSYLRTFVDEEACRRSPRCWFYVMSADLCRGLDQAEYSPEPDGPWDAPLLEHLLGSVAVPFLFPPVKIPACGGAPRKVLVDGHLTSFVDLPRMVERGARDFLFVSVAAKTSLARPRYNVGGYVSTLVEHMLQGQIDNSLASLRLMAPEHGIRAFEFTPARPLNIGVFSFRKEECRRAFDRGVVDVRNCLRRVPDYRIY